MFSQSDKAKYTRRDLLNLVGGPALISTAGTATAYTVRKYNQPRARVGIYRATSYSDPLARTIRDGLANYPDTIRRARAGTVVLKPNLVEYDSHRSVNTHPAMVAAAIAAFRSVGAKDVVVAEGPGHCRDTELLLEESDLEHAITTEASKFVDLNLDATHPLTLLSNYMKLKELYFADTLLNASVIVSMPKLKTHHWAGVTLSLKNMFGTVPGALYGWPKNILHHNGIDSSIVAINTSLKPHFSIVDGIEGMEGDGPLRGETVRSNVIIMGDNLTAVDATAVRVMGLHPERIPHLRMMLAHGGTINTGRIDHVGESITSVKRDFRVLEDFAELKKPSYVVSAFSGV
jgi:uncharacterized protein (DUF362 family)